jgi:hypothetical protein
MRNHREVLLATNETGVMICLLDTGRTQWDARQARDETMNTRQEPGSPPDSRRAVAAEILKQHVTDHPDFADARDCVIEPLPVRGLQHRHYRLRGVRRSNATLLLRVPRQSFWQLSPGDNLAYQIAAFERTAPSGKTPRLFGALQPQPDLPFGALIVEEIIGRPPGLPADFATLAEALLGVHSLPIPQDTAPLIDQSDPIRATTDLIGAQATAIAEAEIAPRAREAIEEEMRWARHFAAASAGQTQPRALVFTDTQPGNFVIGKDGHARCVDLEKTMYGAPTIDLAHLTIRPSIGWDPAVATRIGLADVADFYAAYLARADARYRDALRPWLAPMRRLTWLRTITIFAKMKAEWRRGGWSGEDLEPAFRDHVLSHIARCHDADEIAAMRAEWLEGPGLEGLLA